MISGSVKQVTELPGETSVGCMVPALRDACGKDFRPKRIEEKVPRGWGGEGRAWHLPGVDVGGQAAGVG